MGNRVLIQFVQTRQETFTGKPKKLRRPAHSPVIYGHWCGSEAATVLTGLREQMSDRPGDIDYVAARCVSRLIAETARNGSTGFGMWNAWRVLKAEDSHGDAGIFLVDISEPIWRVTIIAGRDNERGEVKSTAAVRFTRG